MQPQLERWRSSENENYHKTNQSNCGGRFGHHWIPGRFNSHLPGLDIWYFRFIIVRQCIPPVKRWTHNIIEKAKNKIKSKES